MNFAFTNCTFYYLFKLLSSQTEVSKCKKELHDKSLLLESADKKAKNLGGEVHSLMQQVSGITKHK